MTIKAITPYLILNGKAELAIAHYVRTLGATVETKMRFGDVQPNCPDALKDSVMHAALRVGSATLMLSDGGGDGTAATAAANNVEVALDFGDVAETHRCFDALGAGGKVREPLAAAPWGALFGALTDRFGVQWMFNCEVKPA